MRACYRQLTELLVCPLPPRTSPSTAAPACNLTVLAGVSSGRYYYSSNDYPDLSPTFGCKRVGSGQTNGWWVEGHSVDFRNAKQLVPHGSGWGLVSPHADLYTSAAWILPPPCSPSNSPVRVFDGSIASTTTASAALEPPTSLSVTTYAYAQYTLDRWVCLHMAML